MFVESLKSTGLGLVKDLQNTVANILRYLKETRLVAGKGIRLDKTPNGIIITSTATGGGSTVVSGGGGGGEPENASCGIWNRCYFGNFANNVNIWNAIQGYIEKRFLKNAPNKLRIIMGQYYVNLNGTIGIIKDTSDPANTWTSTFTIWDMVSGYVTSTVFSNYKPISNTILNGLIRIRCELQRVDGTGNVAAPFYYRWSMTPDIALESVINAGNSYDPPSTVLNGRNYVNNLYCVDNVSDISAYFIPVARYSIFNGTQCLLDYSSQGSSYIPSTTFDISLENIDCNPMLMTSMTEKMVNELYTYNYNLNNGE